MGALDTASRRLRERLAGPEPLLVPSVYDGLTARAAEVAGFESVELSGSGAAAALAGLPDVGLVTMTELLANARGVVEAVDVPVVADLDDGGGTPLTIQRTFRTAERIGLAGAHLDDIATGIKFFTGYPRQVVSMTEGVDRVGAAADARSGDDGLVIVARTYAPDPSEAFDRACAYAEAGADVLFLVLTGHDLKETASIAAKVPKPLFRAMTHLPATKEDFAAAGIKMIGTMQPFLAVLKTMQVAYDELATTGSIADVPSRCASPQDLKDLLKVDQATRVAEKFHMISK